MSNQWTAVTRQAGSQHVEFLLELRMRLWREVLDHGAWGIAPRATIVAVMRDADAAAECF